MRSAATWTATTWACSPAGHCGHSWNATQTEICTLTSQGLAFFGDVFGSRFPLRKYDQVFLPEYGGAMENYGCVAWSDGYLTRSEPSSCRTGETGRLSAA